MASNRSLRSSSKQRRASKDQASEIRDVTKSAGASVVAGVSAEKPTRFSEASPSKDIAPRRRGRPPSDPSVGPASTAKRTAKYRERLEEETRALVGALRSAVWALDRLGDHHHLGWMFWGTKKVTLDAIRRLEPAFAPELEYLEARSKAYVLEMHKHRAAPKPPEGPKRGSILLADSVFSTDAAGNVLQDGKKTGFKVAPQIVSWRLVEERPVRSRKVQDCTLQSAEDALLVAATILIERGKGGPLETICPPLDTWQPWAQEFPMPEVTDPPVEVLSNLREAVASGSDAAATRKVGRKRKPKPLGSASLPERPGPVGGTTGKARRSRA